MPTNEKTIITCATCISPRRLDLFPADRNGGTAYECICGCIDVVSADRISVGHANGGLVGRNFNRVTSSRR